HNDRELLHGILLFVSSVRLRKFVSAQAVSTDEPKVVTLKPRKLQHLNLEVLAGTRFGRDVACYVLMGVQFWGLKTRRCKQRLHEMRSSQVAVNLSSN